MAAGERELLGIVEPSKPWAEMTDDELDEFAEQFAAHIVSEIVRRREEETGRSS